MVDQVVVEHGTLPADDLYFELKPASSNLGEIDLDALLAGRPQGKVNDPDGAFQLFRVGDAVASRNIHAAIYDLPAPVQRLVVSIPLACGAADAAPLGPRPGGGDRPGWRAMGARTWAAVVRRLSLGRRSLVE